MSTTLRRRPEDFTVSGPLSEFPLAIVDVETTGQSAIYGRIIEVAVLRVEEGRVVDSFESLLNPEQYISPMIEGLTGISNDAVADSPTFSRIARKLYKILDGALFVAHNARFDYSFVKSEFSRAGIPFTTKCLCTVKLSRKLFSEHRHHDLSPRRRQPAAGRRSSGNSGLTGCRKMAVWGSFGCQAVGFSCDLGWSVQPSAWLAAWRESCSSSVSSCRIRWAFSNQGW